MEAELVLRLRPELAKYLREFESCMGRASNASHLRTYVEGQMGPLQRKSVEPIALRAGTPVRTLQEFIGMFRWDHKRVRDRHQRRVARLHHSQQAIGLIDETSFPKKGNKTACVQRQHCGALGKHENCVVSVHLGYATPDFHTLLDGELYLPEETWNKDRQRCRQAGIPDDVVYRSKAHIALGQVKRALGNGVRFAWMVFDEWYGSKPWFLHELDALGQQYVAELPRNFHVWTTEPRLRPRRHPSDAQRSAPPPDAAPLMVQTNPMITVENLLAHSPKIRGLTWEKYVVNDSTTGPLVWEAIRIPVWLKDGRGLPTRAHHLVIARSLLVKGEIKFFLSNAPEKTSVEDLLFVGFSRWRIERMFEDTKGELGMDHFEVRTWTAIERHLIISCLSHAFLAERVECWSSKSPRPDRLPDARCDDGAGAAVDHRTALCATTR
jgi:SRSO17 transposase